MKARSFAQFVAIVASFVLVMEIVLRTLLLSPRATVDDEKYGLRFRPNTPIIASSEGYIRTRTNSLGLVDDEPSQVAPPLRTLLVGDSHAVALQVQPERSFAGLLEQRIDGHEVINAAQPGSTPVHSLLFLRETREWLQPDLAIVQVSDGDWKDLSRTIKVHLERNSAGELEIRPPKRGGLYDRVYRQAKSISTKSALVNLFTSRLQLLLQNQRQRLEAKLFSAEPALDLALQDEALDPLTYEKLDWLFGAFSQEGLPVVILYVPTIRYTNGPCRYRFPVRREAYRELAAQHDLTLVDPGEAFCDAFARSGQPLHGFQNSVMGEGHMNPAGHSVTTELLVEALGEILP